MNYIDYLLKNDEALQRYLEGWAKSYEEAEEWYRNIYLNKGSVENDI